MTSRVHIKQEIRVLGIDDSALISAKIRVVGTFFRGGLWLDGVLSSMITRDGMDATDVIIDMVTSSKHYCQIRAIMLDGITYGGFNPIDIAQIHRETDIPVIVVMRRCPDFDKIRLALTHFDDGPERFEIIRRGGKISRVYISDSRIANSRSPVYIQVSGISREDASRIIQITCTRGNIPEPLRVAHLIATGIVCGESKGKA